MEGSPAEDLGAPDSWEMADLEEGMTRLGVSSSSSSSSRKSPPAAEFVEDPLPPATPLLSAPFAPSSTSSSSSLAAASGGGRGLRVPGDPASQVDQFLREALEKPRERLSILRMEQDIERFIRDPTQQQLELQPLPTSYLRLAAHRVAQHYCLQSMAVPDINSPDGSGSTIVLRKASECRFPPVRLADIPVNLLQEDNHSSIVKVAIKQRPQKRSLTITGANTHSSKANYPKSVEERKEEYNRARARIFNSNYSSGSAGVKSESEPSLPDGFQHYSLVPTQLEKSPFEGPEINCGRGSSDSSVGSSRSSRDRTEKEPVLTRYKTGNRVAIFRDREVDRKDPDYDRSYDRYMQRFDPGFAFNGGPYGIQPMYSPAVNYNTEFPKLASSHRPQIPLEHQPRPIPQHLQGPWGAASAPTGLGYGPAEGMMAPFNANHVGAHSTSSIYLHSSQYVTSPRPGVGFVHPHEHVQPFAQNIMQTCQQQPEASFGLARPR